MYIYYYITSLVLYRAVGFCFNPLLFHCFDVDSLLASGHNSETGHSPQVNYVSRQNRFTTVDAIHRFFGSLFTRYSRAIKLVN